MNTCVILGNGVSRKPFTYEILKETFGDAPIYGCNALYRDFWPDYLIAIDQSITKEIRQSRFPTNRLIVPPLEDQFEPAEFNPNRPRSNAGMNAMSEAIKHGHTVLYCIGFDFLTRNRSQSNIYENSPNYEIQATPQDVLNRIEYMKWFAQKHPGIMFNFLYPEGVELVSIGDHIENITGTIINDENFTGDST